MVNGRHESNHINHGFKWQRLLEWINNMIHVFANYKRYTLESNTNRLKVKEWKTISHANSNCKRAGLGYTNIRQTD